MLLFRRSAPAVICAVAGLATGAGLYLLYFRLREELLEIRVLIAELKQELAAKNNANGRNRRRGNRTNHSGYYSVTASSGDEDDDFVDAVAGLSDQEVTGRQNGLERNVQFASPVSVEMDGDESDEQFFKEIDGFIAAGSKADYESALSLLKMKEKKMALDAEFQWRFSKVMYFVANAAGNRGDGDQKKELLYLAKDAALAAVNLDTNCPDGHKWYAITVGSIGDYEPTSEKIKNGYLIKEHIQLAIDLNPKDPTPHHMLGRWCYSIYMLSWLERKAAAAFFGAPPTSTVEEALQHFMQAENLNPGKWKENSLYIAKCLVEKRQYSSAVPWLRKAQSEPDDKDVDAEVQTEVVNLLAKYDR
ncbi:regulator of microtubule dynamics protein 1-like [Babylonia areolata]|uniref:regulator of microtubule dynamics protein 1-like n=1 Tax=Babylonia areolata TaxID=304850 RepID=UPI003FD29DB7